MGIAMILNIGQLRDVLAKCFAQAECHFDRQPETVDPECRRILRTATALLPFFEAPGKYCTFVVSSDGAGNVLALKLVRQASSN